MKQLIVLLLFISSNISCDKDNPVKPVNHNPIILSLTVFPGIAKPSDSLIVICDAMDPDGDTLVYDWYTAGGSMRIKGAPPWDYNVLANTHENSQIFYAPDSMHVSAPRDTTFWVQAAARDRKGGMDVKLIHFTVIKN